jgi:two-component system alkaline phosphatase synthesis response regulator PhoP
MGSIKSIVIRCLFVYFRFCRTLLILIVDDDPDILEFVGYNLSKEGFKVHKYSSAKEVIEVCKTLVPDLLILDIMLPDMDGIELCHKLRNDIGLKSIIVFLTARGEDYTMIAGLNAGADDFIKKPIKPWVLVSKIHSLLKRMQIKESLFIQDNIAEGITIDRTKNEVCKNDEKIYFPNKEFQLLLLLTSVPERVFTREEIYIKVWGHFLIVGDRTIDVHIRKLREKLGEHYIQTVKGVGYRFSLEN